MGGGGVGAIEAQWGGFGAVEAHGGLGATDAHKGCRGGGGALAQPRRTGGFGARWFGTRAWQSVVCGLCLPQVDAVCYLQTLLARCRREVTIFGKGVEGRLPKKLSTNIAYPCTWACLSSEKSERGRS